MPRRWFNPFRYHYIIAINCHWVSTNTAEKWSEDVRSKKRFGVQATEPGYDSRDSLSPSRSRSYSLNGSKDIQTSLEKAHLEKELWSPIFNTNRSNSHNSPSKRLPWGRGRAKNRSPPRFGPVSDSFCLVSQFEASWLYILEFETLRTLTAFHRKQSLPKRNNVAGGGGRYGGCCQPDSFWDLLILRLDIAFRFASCCSVRFSLDIDRCNYCVAVA